MPIEWRGEQEVRARMTEYGDRVHAAVRAVADYIAPQIERYAKENAPWTDRTANARQALHAYVEDVSRGIVAVYLSHGMTYGRYLETIAQGRWAIILPALEAHYGRIRWMLREIFRR